MNLVPLEQAIEGPPEPPKPEAPPVIPAPEDGDEDDDGLEENQRAEVLPVVHAYFDRLKRNLDADHNEDMVAAAAMRSLLMDCSAFTDGRCDAIQEQVGGVDKNATDRANAISQQLKGLADGDKELAGQVQAIVHHLDERVRFGGRVLEEAERQLWTKEGKAAIRQAESGGNFLAWMDTFYETHVALCVEKCGLAAVMLGVPAEILAETHVRESQRALLTATECSRDKLIESVTACVAKWGQRETETGETSDDNADES